MDDDARGEHLGLGQDLQVLGRARVQFQEVIPRGQVAHGDVAVAIDHLVQRVMHAAGLGRAAKRLRAEFVGFPLFEEQAGVIAKNTRHHELGALEVGQVRGLAVVPNQDQGLDFLGRGDGADDRLEFRELLSGPGELVAEENAELQLAVVDVAGDFHRIDVIDDVAVQAGLSLHEILERFVGEGEQGGGDFAEDAPRNADFHDILFLAPDP